MSDLQQFAPRTTQATRELLLQASKQDVRDWAEVYSTAQVDALLSGLGALTAEDIDTLSEINAILTDATVLSVSAIGVTVQAYDADTAKLDAAQNWSAPQTALADTITYAGTIEDDADSGSLNQIVTLTGDVTAWTITGGSDYQVRHWWIRQDGTGGRTVTFSGIAGTEPTLSTTADEVTRVSVINDPVNGWRWL